MMRFVATTAGIFVLAICGVFFAFFAPSARADQPVALWGEPANGLRCRAVTVHSSMSEEKIDIGQAISNFQAPEDLAFAVELENVSENSIALLDTRHGDRSKGKSNTDWLGQFLFSIKLIDDAGTKIESPKVQVVDVGCPLDGAPVTEIEPGTSQRFLLRPMKWLSVLMPRFEAGRYRAVVHYHGLPKESKNSIREYQPDSVALRAWSGNVQSLPTEFKIDSQASERLAERHWGESSGGLRSAVEIVPHKSEYAFGEKVNLKLCVQNVSEQPITLATHLWLSDMHITVKDTQENEVEVRGRFYTGWILSGRITLRPQQTATLDAGNLAIAADETEANGFGHVTNRMLVAPAGLYSIQLSGSFGTRFLVRDGKGKQLAPLAGDWSGILTTGATPLVVSESDVR